MSYSKEEYPVFTAISCFSILVCLVAAILVFWLKLYKSVVYRLSLYQVLAALVYAIAELWQLNLLNKYETNPNTHQCTTLGWATLYFICVNLLFTMWVAIHLFCYGALHKDLSKLELWYVVTSLLVPAVVACVPLITNSYGFSPIDGCYIPVYTINSSHRIEVAVVERFVLWEGPAMTILLISSAAMVTLLIKLTHLIKSKYKLYETLPNSDHFWKALKQLVPFTVFSILFCVSQIPYLVYDIHYSTSPSTPHGLVVFGNISMYIWSTICGLSLIVHILVVRLPICIRFFKKRNAERIDERYDITVDSALRRSTTELM